MLASGSPDVLHVNLDTGLPVTIRDQDKTMIMYSNIIIIFFASDFSGMEAALLRCRSASERGEAPRFDREE